MKFRIEISCSVAVLWLVSAFAMGAGESEAPAERGTPASLFGTFVRSGELLVYPFFEYERQNSEEYKPSELGFMGEEDFLGRSTVRELGLFLAYGVTDRFALELEGELYNEATFHRAPEDLSGVPLRIDESGLGDVEAQARYRFTDERSGRPELFGFLEVAFPFQEQDQVLLGTSRWEGSLGIGAIKAYRGGLLTGRVSVAYEADEQSFALGEYALEYLRRLSPRWRVVTTLEGEDDEVSFIGEAQWFFSRRAYLKVNSGFGITGKAPEFAPEIGVMMSFEP